jgi:hypothetical protein
LRTEFEKHLLDATVNNNSPWALSVSMFKHAEGQRPLYKALAGKHGGNIALTHIQKYLFTYLHTHLKMAFSKRKKGIPPEIVAQYISSSFISLLTWWLDTDSPFTAEQMNEYYRQLVEPGVNMIMQ